MGEILEAAEGWGDVTREVERVEVQGEDSGRGDHAGDASPVAERGGVGPGKEGGGRVSEGGFEAEEEVLV